MTRPPPSVLLAALSPTLVLVVAHAFPGAHTPTPAASATLWAATTIPLVLLAFGFSRLGKVGPDDATTDALAALARAERVAQQLAEALARAPEPPPAWSGRAGRRLAPLLAAGLLVVGGSALALAIVHGPASEPVHLHAGFAVFVDGERQRYLDARFDLLERGELRAHLHLPDDGTLHLEGPPGQTLREALRRAIGLEIPSGALVEVDPAGPEGWDAPILGGEHAPREGDRILVRWGTAGDRETERAAVPQAAAEREARAIPSLETDPRRRPSRRPPAPRSPCETRQEHRPCTRHPPSVNATSRPRSPSAACSAAAWASTTWNASSCGFPEPVGRVAHLARDAARSPAGNASTRKTMAPAARRGRASRREAGERMMYATPILREMSLESARSVCCWANGLQPSDIECFVWRLP